MPPRVFCAVVGMSMFGKFDCMPSIDGEFWFGMASDEVWIWDGTGREGRWGREGNGERG